MKLGVNGWRVHGRRTGVGRYLVNVVRHWTSEVVAGRFDEINFYSPEPVDPATTPLPETVRERVVGPPWRMLVWENLRMARASRDDVLFCPSYTRPLVAPGKTVVTIHDATAHLYPELYPRSVRFYDRLYGWSARRATLVVTSCEAVRGEIARSYGVSPSRIRVVNLATEDHIRPLPDDPRVEEVRRRYLKASVPFFLFIGKLAGRRNVPKLLEAFAELKRRESLPHKLVIIGLPQGHEDVPELAARQGVERDVAYREYIDEEDLVLLYNAAEAFIMPSTYEGLSLPVMEAQAVGTPVITIDAPGMRETTGGAALFMPRAAVGEITKAMALLAKNESLRAELAEAGLKQAASLSWERCSAETLDVIEEAAELVA